MASAEELFVMAAYLSGAVCIVLFTLAVGWIIVWRCVLSKMPFVQELFDLKPTKPALPPRSSASKSSSSDDNNADEDERLIGTTESSKPTSFQDRVEASKRVRICMYGQRVG